MNPETGMIARFKTQLDAMDAGHTVELTDEEATKLESVEPGNRMSELAKFRGSKILTRAYIPPRRERDK
jgi:hypothetical protein